jgi:carbon-monoxide dehydrogenase medium subunit
VSRDLVFLRPRSPEEAVDLLRQHGDDARVIAGGTALTIMLRQGLVDPGVLISLGDVGGLADIARDDGTLRIGALVTHRAVETSALVARAVPGLTETFATVANVRIRYVATVGGVLAEADYASDPPAALLALDGVVEALGPSGAREIPVADFFRSFYETALAPDEIVTAVRVPVSPLGMRAVYAKYVTRSSEDRPCVGVFVAVRMEGSRCADLRVAVVAAAETPRRFVDLEARALGLDLTEDIARQIADDYAERIDTLTDMRGSAWYRTEMIRVWVRRAIERASSLSRAAA